MMETYQVASRQEKLAEVEEGPALAESLPSVPSSCHTAHGPALVLVFVMLHKPVDSVHVHRRWQWCRGR